MSIKRIIATKDNTISTAFKSNLNNRASTSNMGASDILEIFSIFGHASSGSLERARVLVQFPVGDIQTLRAASEIPASGSVSFVLKLFNAEHGQTTPSGYTISAVPLVRAWNEGEGLDMESYLDKDSSNWFSASSGTPWYNYGGDFVSSDYIHTSPVPLHYDKYLDSGLEDFEINITPLVEEWLKLETGAVVNASGSIILADNPPETEVIKFYTYDGEVHNIIIATASATVSNNHYIERGSTKENTLANIKTQLDSKLSLKLSSSVESNAIQLTHLAGGFYGNSIISASFGSSVGTVVNFNGGDGAINYGLVVKLSGSYESGETGKSYYTKKFFARSSHHYFEKPIIEIQWDDSKKDDRGNIIRSSSLAPAADNMNTIYFYNRVRGQMRDIPSVVEQPTVEGSHFLVQFVTASGAPAETVVGPALNLVNNSTPSISHTSASTTYIAAKRVSKGIYKAEFAYSGDSSQLRDVWTLRNISGDATFDLGQENSGASGETEVDLSSVTNITSSTPTFTGSGDFREVTIKVSGLPANNDSFTLFDNEDPPVTGSFIFKTNSDVFNDADNLESGKMIIGIQSVTSSIEVASRMQTAVTTKLSIEPGTGDLQLDSTTDVYTQVHTGSLFSVYTDNSSGYNEIPSYVVNITNLKPSYHPDEVSTFRVYTRNKNWKPNLYTVAQSAAPINTIRDAYYKVSRPVDNTTIIEYSTGSSTSYSSLSYDASGSYFDLDMSILEPNYLYEISFLYKDGLDYIEQKEKFKFRVNPKRLD